MLAYLNRFAFSFFFCLVVMEGCGSGVLQANGASTAAAFAISGAASAAIGTPVQYSTSLGADATVSWSIRGTSTSEDYGTISATGVYTPPKAVPVHNVISIVATSTSNATKSSSTSVTITNPVPVVSSVTATPGYHSTFLVQVTGSNFLPSSLILYNGYGVTTTYVSPTVLQFTLSTPPAAGTIVPISVGTPAPGKTVSANFSFTVPPTVAVQVNGDVLATPARSVQYAASVTGTTDASVTWAVQGTSAGEDYGSISPTGLYTPPAKVPTHGTISVAATSTVDSTKSGSLTVTISNPVPTVTSASFTPKGRNTFLVDVTGSNFIPSSVVLYTGFGAPTTYLDAGHLQFTLSNSPAAGTVTPISVVSPAPGRTQSANYNLTIPGAVAITASGPAQATISSPVQYTASVSGASNTAVAWSIKGASATENYGTISAAGLYSPPATVPAHNTITVVATSQADTSKTASATVALMNPVPSIASATSSMSGRNIRLSIAGSGFLPSTIVQLQGTSLATTYVDPNTLTALITTAQTAGALVPIQAVSPNPGQTRSASYVVQLPGTVAVSVVGSTELAAGQTAHYGANVSGTSNTDVTWSVQAAGGADPGTISSAGVYSPPSSVGGNLPVTITATSAAQPNSTGSLTVTVVGVSVVAAGRLLDQSTFGPTQAMVSHVQQIGLSNFIDEQLAMPPSLLPLQSQLDASCAPNPYICINEYWWKNATTAPDQLRQRVSMALTEMLVVSYEEANTAMVGSYSNIMTRDAFANWATIMKDVTLSPAMGRYLNMANSGKPARGAIANENFARENMQLFNLGLYLLNQDGTLQTDSSGNPIPTYTEAQVEAFARVFTGWSYDTGTSARPVFPTWSGSPYIPMVATESAHDTSSKALLNTTLPAGQTAEQDLDAAIQDVFNHPNVGPFVSKQLIQHLIKSNPSPEYVGRIAAVFADDGNGVRGNMAAVVKALLLDPEARAGDLGEAPSDGILREPIIWTANILRALNAVPKPLYNDYTAYTAIDTFANSLGQRVFNSPTVFNFYPAEWKLMNTGLNGPQFALETTATIMQKLTLSSNIVNNQLGRLTVDLSATSHLGTLAAASNDVLLQELSNLFLHGQMSDRMHSAILNAISNVSDPGQRVRTAVYLIISSPQYRVIH